MESTSVARQSGPLAGKLVLDLGRVIAAPYAAQTLADLGAEVIKIERPGTGDDSRHYPPVYMPGGSGRARGDAAHFVSVNRNKRSICADLSRPEGQDIVRRLAAQADVLIENYKPGTLARQGLGWDQLHALNPRLVYCSVSAFGQDGPYAPRGGFDPVVQAMSGFMSVTGRPDGEPGAAPTQAGIVMEDVITGKDAATAVLAALYERDTVSGLGQYIDVALFDSAVALMTHAAQGYLLSGVAPTRHPSMGTQRGISATVECADGRVYFTASRNSYFRALCQVLGCPELASDPRYATGPDRWTHREELGTAIRERARSWLMMDLATALADAGVPAGPVYDLAQTFADPQARHRALSVPLPHPDDPSLKVVASPLRLSRTPVRYEEPPPRLGQHTQEVLQQRLGFDAQQIARLRESGII